MSESEYLPPHLRGLPASAREGMSEDDDRFLQDLHTRGVRTRRRVQAEGGAWAFPVPEPMAHLFDALTSPFTTEDALRAGESLGMGAAAVEEAVGQMQRHELVSPSPEGYVRHEESRNWF